MKIRGKMILSLGIGSLSILLVTAFALGSFIRSSLEKQILNELEHTMDATVSIVDTAAELTVRNHLRSVADMGRELCNYFYQKELAGEMTREEAINGARSIILDAGYGKVGETGYLAAVDTKGVLRIHPSAEGVDASKHEFMQRAMAMKNGYL